MIKGISYHNKYQKAIQLGFDSYGLNGFYEMHKDTCNNMGNLWSDDLEVLNELSFEEFESLCTTFLRHKCERVKK